MALIKANGLSLGYEGLPIVTDLTFSVEEGDYLCIVGENGSGKSTLMKTLLGLRTPLSGNLEYGDGLKRTEIGYLPQQTPVQRDFPASVYEVVLSGCLNRCGLKPFYGAAEKARALSNMEKLGIARLSKRCYRELSGGQQQRVLLARALCATGKLLLLDEPVAGLDPTVTRDMYALIDSLNKNDGITVIMVSHDVNAALAYSTKILHVGHTPRFFGMTADYLTTDCGRAFASSVGEATAAEAAKETVNPEETGGLAQ